MALDQYAIITLADLKATLGITVSTYDAQLEQAIDAASYQVESYLRRKVVQRRVYEWTTSGGEGCVALRWAPVGHVHYVGSGRMSALQLSRTTSTDIVASVSVQETQMTLTRVQQDGSETVTQINFGNHRTSAALVAHINTVAGFSATLVKNCKAEYLHRFAGRDLTDSTATLTFADNAQMDTRIDAEAGLLYLTGGIGNGYERWPSGDLTLLIDYEAGWAAIPPDIEAATRLLAGGIYYARQRDSSLTGESLGDYSYTLDTRAQSEREAFRLLDPYRRLR